jgi:hypothetical protein
MRLLAARFLAFMMLKARVWPAWSWVYRFFREWGHRNDPMPDAYQTFAELEQVLGRMKWAEDGPAQLWDAASLPQATYSRHASGKPAGDCEDIALFAVWALKKMARRSLGCSIREEDVFLLTVLWLGEKGLVEGHSVCLFRYPEKGQEMAWAWVGNWNGGAILWKHQSVASVVAAVRGEMRLLRWARLTEGLRVVDTGTKDGQP